MEEIPLLSVNKLSVHYQQIQAVMEVSFTMKNAEILALLGANGAGKTSTLRALSRLIPFQAEGVHFQGKSIQAEKPTTLVQQRLIHVPEGRGIFLNLTVLENLRLSLSVLKIKDFNESLDRIYQLFPILHQRLQQSAGTLSGGEQQMLALARALLFKPILLLLDEPSLGLAPQMIERIFELIVQIRSMGTAVLLVEQNAHLALNIADSVVVLENGRQVFYDSAEKARNSAEIQKAYLGDWF